MSQAIDYAGVGLKVGLEVHQQLLTARKLFCRCAAGRHTREHDAQVLRHMRPTLSELGVYDGTALMEFRTRKQILYLLDRRGVCTYEMDDTPPFRVDEQAIDIAIEQCLMLGCDIVDEVHIARKQYLDGSIPTGFQRTAIVGVGGGLPFRGRLLSVIQVSVEEDSCREVSDVGHLITWRTDRLGTPLIETVTGPDLRTPEEVAEAILLVGRVCRSTRHVRVGPGASRQDVNVSVHGGTRVEIKGVPYAHWAPALVHGEAVRQVNLLRIREALHARGMTARDDVRLRAVDVTDRVPAGLDALSADGWQRWTDAHGRRPGLELGHGPFTVRALRLEGLRDLIGHPTQPGQTLRDELAGRVRVVAGLDQPPVLLADGDATDSAAWQALREASGAGESDALVVVWGPEQDTVTAAEEVHERLIEATAGVPAETRQPFVDGHTEFERILPGPDRMYPDTDSPPTRVTRARVAGLQATLPPPPWQREARYAEAGVSQPVAYYLIRRGGAALVDRLAPASAPAAEVRRAAWLVGEQIKGWRRAGLATDAVPEARWAELFTALTDHPALRDIRRSLVGRICQTPEVPLAELLTALAPLDPPGGWQRDLRAAIAAGTGERPGLDPAARRRWHVGQALGSLRGHVPGAAVAAVVDEALAAAPVTPEVER